MKKSLIGILSIFLILSFILPFNLFADTTATYFTATNECVNAIEYNTQYNHYYVHVISDSDDVRFTIEYDSTSGNYGFLWPVSPTSGHHYKIVSDTNSACTLSNPTDSFYDTQISGVKWYYKQVSFGNRQATYSNGIVVPDLTISGTADAVSYTWGNNAVGPTPVINYGDLKDLGFQTYFTNTQQSSLLASRNNKDVITWDGYEDTNGNQINTLDYMVDIQAYQTEYSANTKSDLLNLTINSYTTIGEPVTLVSMGPNYGRYEITWGEVAQRLVGTNMISEFFNNFIPHYYEGLYYTNGWLYRIRLRTQDNSYVGDWQIIYQITSAPPSDSSTIMQYYYQDYQYGYDNRVINTINNMNTYNNTNNQYFINELPIDTDTNSNGSSWWDALLRLIEKLIDALTDIFIELLKGIVQLITDLGVNLLQTFTNLWNSLLSLIQSIDVDNIDLDFPDLSSYNELVQRTINVFLNNGLAYMIFIPLIVAIVRLIL